MLRDLIEGNRCSDFSVEPERLEQIARICERHTGAGLTMRDIVEQNLPITPPRDLVPETLEEKTNRIVEVIGRAMHRMWSL